MYLDVATIRSSAGTVEDHMLVMRRMPDELRLARLVSENLDCEDHLRALARLLAGFHAKAVRSPAITAEAGAIGLARRWNEHLRETERYCGTTILAREHRRIGELARSYIAGRLPLFEQRAAAGRYVDGHGDLTADDIFCLPDHPRVHDCIDFDERLRWVDVADDVAFLAMDIERLALRHLDAGQITLTLIGGAPGTGKTTVAGRLATATGATLLSTRRDAPPTRGVGDRPVRPSGQGRRVPRRARPSPRSAVPGGVGRRRRDVG